MVEITDNEIEKWEKDDSHDSADNEYQLDQLRVIRSNHDYTLDYWKMIIGKNLNLGPEYQRRSRWSVGQRSSLIESLLLNIPVPPIFLFEKDYHEYEVVDGRQRLEAINDFLKDKYSLSQLQFLNQLKGKKFTQLDLDIQRLLLRRTVSATILLAESKGQVDDLDIRMILFDRLNTGGVKLNAQELRNAVMSGSFNELLHELSSGSVFRELWGIPNPSDETDDKLKKKKEKAISKNPLYKTMMDCELVLRFFAIRDVAKNKDASGSMRKLLDSTMKSNKDKAEAELAELRKEFIRSISGMKTLFAENAFLNPILSPKRKARNLYDSFMVAYSMMKDNEIAEGDKVLKGLEEVLKDKSEYEKIITKGNSIENIRYRVDKAKELLAAKHDN